MFTNYLSNCLKLSIFEDEIVLDVPVVVSLKENKEITGDGKRVLIDKGSVWYWVLIDILQIAQYQALQMSV